MGERKRAGKYLVCVKYLKKIFYQIYVDGVVTFNIGDTAVVPGQAGGGGERERRGGGQGR